MYVISHLAVWVLPLLEPHIAASLLGGADLNTRADEAEKSIRL
jgi:hypothetical protein